MSKTLISALVLTFVVGAYMALPRGIRNNNPGNIRHGDNWRGMKKNQTDKSFVQFVSPEYGIRAMVKVLRSYRKRGVVTLEDIIQTWAPTNENNTEAYIKSVMSKTGWSRGHVVAEMEGDYKTLIPAIIKHENGFNPYSMETIAEGVALA